MSTVDHAKVASPDIICNRGGISEIAAVLVTYGCYVSHARPEWIDCLAFVSTMEPAKPLFLLLPVRRSVEILEDIHEVALLLYVHVYMR